MNIHRLQFRTLLRCIMLLYFATFCVILPIICWNRPFSRYYIQSSHTVDGAIADDLVKGRKADEYFAQLRPQSSNSAFRADEALQLERPKFAVGIITVRRRARDHKKYGPRYLTRVVAEFDKLLKTSNRKDIAFFVCNAQNIPHAHREAWNLTKYVHVVSKGKTEQHRAFLHPREQEKRDYAFCMRQIQTFNAEYSILVQDDALPYPQFISSLDRLLDTRIERQVIHGRLRPNREKWAAVKFYFPEKWQGYGNEARLIVELIAESVFGGGILYGLCRLLSSSNLSWSQSCFIFIAFCVYCGLLLFIIGRPYVLMLRRLSVDLYAVRGAPECCIPAVLYKTSSLPRILDHLQEITCSIDNPLDIAISKYLARSGEKQYLVMPNLFNHIGMFSTLHRDANSPHVFLG